MLEKLAPEHNRRFAKSALKPTDAHRRLGPGHRLESILSIQTERVVANDYVVRWANRFYQLLPPVYAGERGGRVVIEQRLNGTMAIRFGKHYLAYREILAPQRGGEGESVAKKKTNGKRTQQPSRPWQPPADHPWRKRVVR